MREKFLPLGSVVLLKNASKKLMITGYCSSPVDGKGKFYDYTGVLYPEGLLSSDKTALFNHSQIDKIFFLGFENDESKAFINSLNVVMGKLNISTTVKTEAPASDEIDTL